MLVCAALTTKPSTKWGGPSGVAPRGREQSSYSIDHNETHHVAPSAVGPHSLYFLRPFWPDIIRWQGVCRTCRSYQNGIQPPNPPPVWRVQVPGFLVSNQPVSPAFVLQSFRILQCLLVCFVLALGSMNPSEVRREMLPRIKLCV